MYVVFLFGLLVSTAARAADPAAEIEPRRSENKPDEVLNFRLLDYHGTSYELHRADARAVVLFFAGNGCPIVRQNISKVRSLRRKFADQGVVFWLINANSQDDRESIAQEAAEFNYGSLLVLKDDTQGVARSLQVKRTAEAVCINTKDWTVFYRGAIDDQLTEGAKKEKPTEKYLENALNEFVAGNEISHPKANVTGCLIKFEEPAAEKGGAVSYAKDIAPLLQRKCVACHSAGNIAPFTLSSYKKVKGWSAMIQEVLLAKRMPPWHADPHYGVFQNDRSLSIAEAQTLLHWIEQDCPRGEGEDPLLTAVVKAEPWPLGKPDHVISLPLPQEVPATGVLDYRHVGVQSPLTNDVWLRAVIVRPGNRKVVHHVIVRILYPAGLNHPEEEVFFTSWAPGNTQLGYPEGTGKFLPKGVKLDFEMHYNTIGKPETDQTEIGLYLMNATPKMVLETRTTETRDLNIPPGETDARSFCLAAFKRDTLIFDLVPHMHLRGSWFKYEVLFPDGRRELLLSVPNYDFNWQTEYRFVEPKRVPAGAWLLCTGGHDNSAKNPCNPDPKKRIKHGLQSFEEMFMGFMNVAEINADVPPKQVSSNPQSNTVVQ